MPNKESESGRGLMIAVPVENGQLGTHFGHCGHFLFFTVDRDSKQVIDRRLFEPPPHEPGVLPRWLSDQGTNVVLSGGLGGRAASLLNQFGIEAVVGISSGSPDSIVRAYLEQTLPVGQNLCDH
jgi:predicted Fe-Mo cluster-binding NifX family protein